MELLILIITGIISAVGTYLVNNKYKQGPVRASALLSLLVGLFFYFFPNLLSPELTKNIPLVFIGASFIGMVSSKVLSSYIVLSISGIIFSILFVNSSKYFAGYGGGLGATAAISLLISLSLALITEKKLASILKKFRSN